jgi:hypothetical protein
MYPGIDRTFAALAIAEQVATWLREDEGDWRDDEWEVLLNRFDIALWRLGQAGAQQCFFLPTRPSTAEAAAAFTQLLQFVADCALEAPVQACKAMCAQIDANFEEPEGWPINYLCRNEGWCALGLAACVECFVTATQGSRWFLGPAAQEV